MDAKNRITKLEGGKQAITSSLVFFFSELTPLTFILFDIVIKQSYLFKTTFDEKEVHKARQRRKWPHKIEETLEAMSKDAKQEHTKVPANQRLGESPNRGSRRRRCCS